MKSTDAMPAYETEEIGTPRDYTEDLYKYYFEVRDVDDIIKQILAAYSKVPVEELPHGYEATLCIQMVPDIVREITSHNMAIYQIIRYTKTELTVIVK